MIDWRPDVLGTGFEYTDLPLATDEQQPLTASLVRSLPEKLPLWQRPFAAPRLLDNVDVLYVHGWGDYFFQTELARFFTARGARFFALDLRRYGRSLRDGQIPCYIEDLAEYDEEINLAIEVIGTSAGRRLLLFGHSTGGLVLSLWANRNRGMAAGLVLNSPWLELQLSSVARKLLAPMVNMRAMVNPHQLALPQFETDLYMRAQREVCDPAELAGINLAWRPESPFPVTLGWLRAILAGHATVEAGIDVGAPVSVLLSQRTVFSAHWQESMKYADSVIEVEQVARAALRIGSTVTIDRIEGALHDVFVSGSVARQDAYTRLERWLCGWQAVAVQRHSMTR